MADQKDQAVSYKDTLNLPQTDFPIRAQATIDDPIMIERWKKEDLYSKTFFSHEGAQKFILHDGPPYANGNIHVGHAYNKILKDIIGKSRRMSGMQVPITPGWDCHGLPIELKVTQENPGLPREQLKKKCREYATHWINVQRQEFERLGVLMNWQHPYLTMNFEYEADILRAFGIFVQKGYIERKNKTVPWCPSCQTVLATAEIEYQDRKDPSIYVLFALPSAVIKRLLPSLQERQVDLAIWTTTPWTLPLNRAVLINPTAQYAVLEINGKYVVVEASLADSLCAQMGIEKKEVDRFKAHDLIQLDASVHHPFIDRTVPLIASPSVSVTDGTAFVHCAPGCGPEDYEIGITHNLEIFSPISPDGKYTSGIEPVALQGMPVADGQIWVIKELAARDRLLYKTSIRHSYPHCWRCRNGLIFRATKQWFCDLSKNNLKQRALDTIEKDITTLPESASNRLSATVEGRLEWCLSRQRVWGVPIPALLCKACDATIITPEIIEKVAQGVAKEGVEYWDRVTIRELIPVNQCCFVCKQNTLIKETDILDVWFDSGVSHYAVLEKFDQLRFPADMYLEGKDQHRGWFQSSLLTALVIEEQAPMKTILTHGFTVDEQGRKMSKSLGNIVTPQQMIDQLGTDGFRLWVSSIDLSSDVVISPVLLENVKEVFRKIRNTCRFLVSNLYDFDTAKDAVSFDTLLAIDKQALIDLLEINQEIIKAYERYDFTAVFHILSDYCAVDLSALYLDVIKDRLYVEKATGHKRRSAQTACWYILDTLTRLLAPILSFTAEQISDVYQKDKKESIHLQPFATLKEIEQLNSSEYIFKDLSAMRRIDTHALDIVNEQVMHANREQLFNALKDIRSAVLKALEGLREKGIIRHSLEARVTVCFAPDLAHKELLEQFFESFEDNEYQDLAAFFKEFFIVSQLIIAKQCSGLEKSEYPGLMLKVEPAQGDKCPRCWNYDITTHVNKLCNRCQAVLK